MKGRRAASPDAPGVSGRVRVDNGREVCAGGLHIDNQSGRLGKQRGSRDRQHLTNQADRIVGLNRACENRIVACAGDCSNFDPWGAARNGDAAQPIDVGLDNECQYPERKQREHRLQRPSPPTVPARALFVSHAQDDIM